MSHLRLDDGFMEHPTTGPLTAGAKLLHIAGMLYCSRNLTDGALEGKAVRLVMLGADAKPRHLAELKAAGCWAVTAAGYEIPGYLDYNPSAAQVKADREAARNRMRNIRAGGSSPESSPERSPERALNVHDSLPSPPLKSVSSPPSPTHYQGEDDKSSEGKAQALIRACATIPGAQLKLERTIAARRPSYETLTRALDAAKAPCDSPLAVALAIIAPKRQPSRARVPDPAEAA